MNNVRKQSILEKLAKHKPGHNDMRRLARKGSGAETAGRVMSYGGIGALGASMLAKSPHSGRLAGAGIASILGSMIARDIAQSQRGKARRKMMEQVVAANSGKKKGFFKR